MKCMVLRLRTSFQCLLYMTGRVTVVQVLSGTGGCQRVANVREAMKKRSLGGD